MIVNLLSPASLQSMRSTLFSLTEFFHSFTSILLSSCFVVVEHHLHLVHAYCGAFAITEGEGKEMVEREGRESQDPGCEMQYD
jgi:hypothetical protein